MTGDVLTTWVEATARDRGIRFFLGHGKGVSTWTFDRLAERVQEVASALVARGARPGDVLAIVAPTSPEFVTLFFAAALAGCWANPLPPPSTFSRDPETPGIR